ncbi:MAG: nucleotidyltransferase domain-containing protein [Nanoarchaeota archaeon]
MRLIQQKEAIEEIRALKKELKAERAILFGSVARGQQHEYSDIDVIFIVDTQERFVRRIGTVLNMYSGHLPIEPIVYTPEEFASMRRKIGMREMLRGAVEI